MNRDDTFFQQQQRQYAGQLHRRRYDSDDADSPVADGRIEVDFRESDDIRYVNNNRLLQQKSPSRGTKGGKSSAGQRKSLNDDFEEVKKSARASGGPNDSSMMEQQRLQRLQKMSSLKRHSNDEAPDKRPFMATMSLKRAQPFEDDSTEADKNDKRTVGAAMIMKAKSIRHLVVESSSGESDDNDDNNTKPPLVLVDESRLNEQRVSTHEELNENTSSAKRLTPQRSSGAGTEVDFYNNPTILSRLILNEKYTAAMRRVYDYPKETTVWVCAKRLMTVLTPAPPRTASSGSNVMTGVPKGGSSRRLTTSMHVESGNAGGSNVGLTRASSTRSALMASSAAATSFRTSKQQLHQSQPLPQQQGEIVYSLRQLPIHIACANLRRTHDSKMKKLLNDLIANLIFANPDGSHEMDHNGRYPIHEAIWHGATAETISLFLLAKPSSVHLKDHKGRSLQEVNKYGPGSGNSKTEIQRILELDEHFWKQARKEAMFRLLRKSVKWPSDSSSIGSLSVLASSKAEEESISTGRPRFQPVDNADQEVAKTKVEEEDEEEEEEEEDDDSDDGDSQGSDEALASLGSDEEEAAGKTRTPKEKEPQVEKKVETAVQVGDRSSPIHLEVNGVTPLSWDQLEARALASEQILMDMNEKYFEMSKKVEALMTLGHQHHGELVSEITRLSRENNSLNNNLHRLEIILTKISDLGEDVFNKELRRACTEVASSTKSLLDISSTDSSYDSNEIEKNESKIREKLGTLSQNHFQQRERIRKLAHLVGKLVLQEGTASLKTPSDHSAASSVSALTSKSAKSYWSESKRKEQELLQPIVDHVPTKTMKARQAGRNEGDDDDEDQVLTEDDEDVEIVDNLDDVFKFAAANDVHISPRGKIVRLSSTRVVGETDNSKVKEKIGHAQNQAAAAAANEDKAAKASGRPQRRNSILVRPEAAMAIAVLAETASTPADVDIPALIPDDYEFEPIKVSDWEERIYKK